MTYESLSHFAQDWGTVYFVVIFAVAPQSGGADWGRTLTSAALFGFFAYATYDLTNLATLRNWPASLAAIDIASGRDILLASTTSLTTPASGAIRLTAAGAINLKVNDGGNNGAIVAPSADLDLALRAIAFAAMATRTCAASAACSPASNSSPAISRAAAASPPAGPRATSAATARWRWPK